MQHMLSNTDWLRWIADQVAAIRSEQGGIKARLEALEGKSRWGWLASVPWKALGWLIGGTVLMLSGHMSVPDLKAWLGLLH